jgi:hypothetical protein
LVDYYTAKKFFPDSTVADIQECVVSRLWCACTKQQQIGKQTPWYAVATNGQDNAHTPPLNTNVGAPTWSTPPPPTVTFYTSAASPDPQFPPTTALPPRTFEPTTYSSAVTQFVSTFNNMADGAVVNTVGQIHGCM